MLFKWFKKCLLKGWGTKNGSAATASKKSSIYNLFL